ncbi:DUF4139 domain-containing protein [Lentibacter sp. XHP0401]|uniref:DUF4139 domain-containing protein n=1 Tax=Lentibacter sp. XHP0401 TaxID=2984334 RepID=UPI0021E7DCD0|nr:DUF4139 domain-containing protein [Lentibacter sp. XHP0401]MCV2893842.1 DUF4139 domain-containing protein [Lentibacter sp. XHP0401]
MRATVLILSLFPSVLVADIIPLTSDVSAVTLYPQGATIVREVPYSMPAGSHELILTDLPRSTDLSQVRVGMTGATMGAITGRSDYVPPRDAAESAEIEAAKAEVERLEGLLREGEEEVLMIRLESEAAEARVNFLRGLGEGEETTGMDAAGLRDLAAMIGDETLAARQLSFEAKFRADEAERALKDTRDELAKAEQALAALQTEDEGTVQLSIAATSGGAAEGVITVSYTHYDAGWIPTYDMRLDKQAGRLGIERGAMIRQGTGEDWTGVALTLSTVRPSEQIEPNEVYAWQRGVMDPPQAMPRQSKQLEMDSLSRADMVGAAAPEPMIVAEEAVAAPSYDGLAVTYDYPEPVNVANRADSLRITLGTVETDAEVLAWAAPLYDATGFMMAHISNDTGELILPTPFMNLYLDGRFMGRSSLGKVIPAGAEADIAFGAIDGLRLTRNVTRNEGDRGMISRSTELSEDVAIEVENLTGQAWPVKLFDRVPYSEQEELAIDWQASPRPSEENYEERQGVLVWDLDVGAGAKQAVTLKYQLEWPEGKVLQ